MDEGAAEKLFRHKVLALLRRRGLLSQERIDLLNSWRRSGFSVHNRVFVHPRDVRDFEALVRYMMRPPVSLARLRFTPGSHEVVYVPKEGQDEHEPTEAERIDAMEFVARVLVQIPDPRRHLVRYYGAYSNASRGKREKAAASAEPSSPDQAPEDTAIPDGSSQPLATPRLRSAPRPAVRQRGKADVSAPHPSPSPHAALRADFTHGPGDS